MYKNYIKVARRNLLKHRSYTLLNILGLSVGLACFMFIWMYVENEKSFDRSFSHYKQIYRVCVKGQMAGSILNQAVTAAPLAQTLRKEVPGVVTATRIARFGDWLVRYEDKRFNESGVLFADSCFFDVFDMPFLAGDVQSALDTKNTVVLSEETAKRYFGNENPIGKLLRIESDSTYYRVTGVVQPPVNCHFHFDFLASLSSIKGSNNPLWTTHFFYTYAVLEEDYRIDDFQQSLDSIVMTYVVPQVENILGISIDEYLKSGNNYGLYTQRLSDIHLHSDLQVELEPNGNLLYVSIFIIVAILILIIACINFMNLATARSSSRAKEVSIRKILGSMKVQLIFQFIVESVFLALIAFGIALVIVELLTPYYVSLVQKDISLRTLLNTSNVVFLLSVVVVAGIVSGSFPAFVIASFNPVRVIKGDLKSSIKSSVLRNYLVIGQFAVSVLIMIFTCTVFRQLIFMRDRDLGFDKERTIVIRRSDGLKKKIADFKHDVEKLPGVLAVGNSTHIPGKNYWYNSFFKEKNLGNTYLLYQSLVSPEYADALGIRMKEGRFFSKDNPGDSLAVVMNESAVEHLGFEHPIGQKIYVPVRDNLRQGLTIIGVMHDFNFKSLHFKVEPMIMTLMFNNLEGYIVVRLKNEKARETIASIQNKWDHYTSDYPFEYFWLDHDFAKLFETERRTASVFLSFSAFSIFIACLGLFGLIAFTAGMRMKEIGIRKSLGATFGEIIYMLTYDTLKLIGIALLFAWPASFLIIRWWLNDYSYKIQVNYLDFLLAALIAILIAFFTIFFQAAKAARVNPADAMRYE
ncbi:MAG TPA: ABC transporter permease [Bacteroidales bacterium]|nr:ABC transporter permease [Bacteroidales bacterium]